MPARAMPALALIAEYERALELLCIHPELGRELEKWPAPLSGTEVSLQHRLLHSGRRNPSHCARPPPA